MLWMMLNTIMEGTTINSIISDLGDAIKVSFLLSGNFQKDRHYRVDKF